MTDLAERRAPAPEEGSGVRPDRADDAPAEEAVGRWPEPIPPARAALATLSAAAGAIHLAMAPSHAGESLVEGLGFAGTGWLQLAAAMALLAAATRRRLAAVAAVNAGLIVVWAISRTAGLPFGEHAGHAESVSAVDLTCVAIEAVLILGAVGLLARRGAAGSGSGDRAAGRRAPVVAGLVSVAAVIAATTALVSPSARDHAAASHGDHAAAGHGHGGDAAAADDKGLSLLSNGHHHEIVQHDLDAETQARLDRQLDVTRQVADRYPTVADAEAAGYTRAGPYFPGIGAHYISPGGEASRNSDGTMDREALLNPMAIIYDGTEPDSRVAGFMYYSMAEDEPEGFAGPNDVWHYHENLCLARKANGEINTPLGLDNQATAEQCAQAGGELMDITQWMLHVWSVPGYDDVAQGTFAELNTDLNCSDGTYYQLPIEEWADHPMNVCRADAA